MIIEQLKIRLARIRGNEEADKFASNPLGGRWALADGTTNSTLPAQFAQFMADEFVKSTLAPKEMESSEERKSIALETWLRQSASLWSEFLNHYQLKPALREAMESYPSSTTLVGVSIKEIDLAIEVQFIVHGDCFLFLFDPDTLICQVLATEKKSENPDLTKTINAVYSASNDSIDVTRIEFNQPFINVLKVEEHRKLLLTTDALGEWIKKRIPLPKSTTKVSECKNDHSTPAEDVETGNSEGGQTRVQVDAINNPAAIYQLSSIEREDFTLPRPPQLSPPDGKLTTDQEAFNSVAPVPDNFADTDSPSGDKVDPDSEAAPESPHSETATGTLPESNPHSDENWVESQQLIPSSPGVRRDEGNNFPANPVLASKETTNSDLGDLRKFLEISNDSEFAKWVEVEQQAGRLKPDDYGLVLLELIPPDPPNGFSPTVELPKVGNTCDWWTKFKTLFSWANWGHNSNSR